MNTWYTSCMARDPETGRFVAGSSGNPQGRPRNDAAPLPREHHDGWQNLLSGVGQVSLDKRCSTTFVADTVDYSQAVELMRGDDTAAHAVEKLPAAALRPGFDLQVQLSEGSEPGAAKDLQERIEQRWKDLDVMAAIRRATFYERAYGGGAIVIGAADGQDIRTPLRPELIKSVDYLTVYEPREIVPAWDYDDPFAPKFRETSIYHVSPIVPGISEEGTGARPFEIHESRIITFHGVQVNNERRRHGWGDSVLTRLWRILRDFNTIWDSAAVLGSDFAQSIFKIKDLAKIIANDDLETFKNRLKALELGRSTVRAAVLDADEEFERKATPMSGFPELLDRFESRVAAAVGMPVTVLFGRSPAGLNATGESDLQLWNESISEYRDLKIVPPLSKLTTALLAEDGTAVDSWEVSGRPIKEADAKEEAETRKLHAETAAIMITSGVLFPEEVADSFYGGDTYSPEIVVDFKERAKLEAEAEVKQAEADAKALEIANAQTPNPEDPTAPAEGDEDPAPTAEESEEDAE